MIWVSLSIQLVMVVVGASLGYAHHAAAIDAWVGALIGAVASVIVVLLIVPISFRHMLRVDAHLE